MLWQARKNKTKKQVLEVIPTKQLREKPLITIDEDKEEREENPLIKKKPKQLAPIIPDENSESTNSSPDFKDSVEP